MDVGRSFTYIFEDPRWLPKVAIGSLMLLLSVFIVPGFIVLGYMLQLFRNMLNGEANPLPEWSDMGQYLPDGFKFFLAYFVYSLPLIAIYGVAFIALVTTTSRGNESAMTNVGIVAFVSVTYCLAPLYGLALALFLPALFGSYVTGGSSIGAALRVREILATFRRNIGDFVIVALLSVALGFLAYMGVILCFIGVFVTGLVAYLIWTHLAAQAYGRAIGVSVAPPLPQPPPVTPL